MAPFFTGISAALGGQGGFGFGKSKSGSRKISATGGTISTPGNGYTYHTFTSPGSFIVSSGLGNNIEIAAIGGGGGGGGQDAQNGGGGAGGGAAVGTLSISPGTYTVFVGGGGGGGASNVPGGGAGGGPAGSNGGGTGGGANGLSGGGGGGGGWSGFAFGSTYYVVGGGGAGGGGAQEGPANDIPARGGGSPSNTYRPDSTTGTSGSTYPNDGGGYGGCGGGVSNSTGTAGGGSGSQSQSGGSNFTNPILSLTATYAGGAGLPNPGAAGSRAPGFTPANPNWNPIPATAGNGGSANSNPGTPGVVVVRYPV